jgi:sec-independent protein translocase protein TatA
MLNIGPAEIVVILVLALLVFGPKRLPEMGRSLGRTVREFRKATESVTHDLGVDEVMREVNDVKNTVSGSFDEVKKTVTGSYDEARDGLEVDLDAHDDEVLSGEVVDDEPPAAGPA